MNDPDARQFHILVVGHTDDHEVVKPGTKVKHETNWNCPLTGPPLWFAS